jgi:hypothetical protein
MYPSPTDELTAARDDGAVGDICVSGDIATIYGIHQDIVLPESAVGRAG